MTQFDQDFDPETGRITWETVDEQGDQFSLSIGPNPNDQTQLLIEWTLPDGSSYSRTV